MTAYVIAIIFIAAMFLGIFCATAEAKEKSLPRAEINVPRLSEAIRAVENTPYHHIGTAGERSSWQITADVWEAHTDRPFWWASVLGGKYDSEVKRVVVLHILWIRRRLASLAMEDSPHNIALVYKAGYGRCLARKTRPEDRDYAARVANVYYDAP